MIGSEGIDTLAVCAGLASICWSLTVAWTAWLRHRYDGERLDHEGYSPIENARLTQLERDVQAMAVELERIAEAHRFTVRLLEQRVASAPTEARPTDPSRAVTPH